MKSKTIVICTITATGVVTAILGANSVMSNHAQAGTIPQTTVQVDTRVRNCQGGYYALTFDDGPRPMTPQYLDALKRLNVKATFFVNGFMIKNWPDQAKRLMNDEHAIVGNHTENHTNLVTANETTTNIQVDSVQKKVVDLGGSSPTLFRPPFGATNAMVRSKIESKQLLLTMWSVDTKDWDDSTTVDSVVNTAMTVQNGGILLMHEDQQHTLDALPKIVNQLEATKALCPGKIVKSDTERPTSRPDLTMNVVAVKP